MRIIIFAMIIVSSGCQKITDDRLIYSVNSAVEQSMHKTKDVAKTSWSWAKRFFGQKKTLPQYCQAIVLENPSLSDLEESFRNEPVAFNCPGSEGPTPTCLKKRAATLAALRLCYEE